MDYENDMEMLDWNEEDYCLPEKTNLGISQCIWNEEDVSYMFSETTPVKACGDVAYHVNVNVNMEKDSQQMNETCLQVKKRRMLQFQSEGLDLPFCNVEMPSVFLKTKDREDLYEEGLTDMTQWVSSFSDLSGYVGMDQSSEEWLDDCFSNPEMNNIPINVSLAGASDVQMDISDYCNNPREQEASTGHKRPTPRQKNIVFKGRKSYTRPQTKIATSIAYPFGIIKPCGYNGDMTLDEINQRIHNPFFPRHKKNSEDPLASCPTSAFSGKPVINKTTIHTEGGRGSITIMKTKG